MKIEIDLKLSQATWMFIKQEAARRNISASTIISEVLSEAVEDYYRDPTKAEILESICIGLQQALNNETEPVEFIS